MLSVMVFEVLWRKALLSHSQQTESFDVSWDGILLTWLH